jgi:hypothetical protein
MTRTGLLIIPPIPGALYGRIYTLIHFSFPHRDRPNQAAAKRALFETLRSQDPASVQALPEALREHGRAFMHDAKGEIIRGENWVRDRAYTHAAEVERHIEAALRQKRGRAAA